MAPVSPCQPLLDLVCPCQPLMAPACFRYPLSIPINPCWAQSVLVTSYLSLTPPFGRWLSLSACVSPGLLLSVHVFPCPSARYGPCRSPAGRVCSFWPHRPLVITVGPHSATFGPIRSISVTVGLCRPAPSATIRSFAPKSGPIGPLLPQSAAMGLSALLSPY